MSVCLSVYGKLGMWRAKGVAKEGCIPCGESDFRVQKRCDFSLDPHIPTEAFTAMGNIWDTYPLNYLCDVF